MSKDPNIIFNKLKKFFKTEFKKNLNKNTKIISGELIDSLDLLKLVSFLEKEFEFNITETDFVKKNFDNLSNLIKFIKKKMK